MADRRFSATPRKEQRCGTCNAYIACASDRGFCAYDPPKAFAIGDKVNGYFPPVMATVWCRRWEQKAEDLP